MADVRALRERSATTSARRPARGARRAAVRRHPQRGAASATSRRARTTSSTSRFPRTRSRRPRLRRLARRGVLASEEPAYWAARAGLRRPDGVKRTRSGIVASLQAEPYERGVVLPHERTHRGPKEGRLDSCAPTTTQLEPIFLLYEGLPRSPTGTRPGSRDRRRPAVAPGDAIAELRATQLLIADGHHRYETGRVRAGREASRRWSCSSRPPSRA